MLGGKGFVGLGEALSLFRARRLRRRYRVLDGGQAGERPAGSKSGSNKKKDKYWN
jgi:hypothetical protein